MTSEPPALEQAKKRRVLPALVGAVAVVVLAVVVVSVSAGTSSGRGVTDPARFDLPGLGGSPRVQLAAYRGKPVVVDLFASWCAACRTELPGMARVAKELQGTVTFIAVDSDDSGRGAGMARDYGLAAAGFVLATDVGGSQGSGLHDALGAPGMPATAFYDASGHVVFKAIEAIPEDTLRRELNRLYGLHV
ncbi:MAG TPA: TlpA disulfide reductase family protein [Acidimicrobiales bacterium]|nr:TlpA disulfide reductase family protein [Acidimicrobiales bacterium]